MIAAHAPMTSATTANSTHVPDLARLRAALATATDQAVNWWGQMVCGLGGHAMMLHFESNRLSLHCANCGRTTPGWAIEGRR